MVRFITGLVFVSFAIGCHSSTKTKTEVKNTVAHTQQFFDKTSPKLLSLNDEAATIVGEWTEMKNVFSNIQTFSQVQDNTIAFELKTLSEQCANVPTGNFPSPFNQPALVGRFRVLKTFIDKAHLTDESMHNTQAFKDNITQILAAYNALVNQLNVVVNESIDGDVIINF